jgi:NO-binding membrane sensor protein with MHYT domain
MPIQYDPVLIALSVAIAIQGAFVSLSLAQRLRAAIGARRKALLAASATSLGIGIWAMHFIGMLAVEIPLSVNYDVLLTLVSALVAVLVVGLGVFVAGCGPLTWLRLGLASLLMGLGIASMHYIGMAAIRANCVVDYAPPLVGASLLVAIVASLLSLGLAFAPAKRPQLMAGAVAMGLAISGMHYTAMAAATFLPAATLLAISAPTLSTDLLAIVIAIAAFVISGFFLLVLMPDQARAEPLPATPHPAGPPALDGSPPDAPRPGEATRLPIQQNGSTRLLPVERIYAIHAEAHYTRVFDGRATWFCPLSITEVERRLDPSRFLRVHRSHIVNVAHASGFKRQRDQGVLELDSDIEHSVPVSRSRLPKLREALGF